MNISRILNAAAFAAQAHSKQERKGGQPYIVHPLEVAAVVAENGGSEDMVIAAILHDVVEDTNVTLAEIVASFGEIVGSYVDDLTDKNPPSNCRTRKERKAVRSFVCRKFAKSRS